jgi:hypothetical protein
MAAAKYDEFICHRGPDTKKDFAIMLKDALKRHKIVAFHDERDLLPSFNAPESMQKAAETVGLGIAILSRGFFESGYCMRELEVFLQRDCLLPILFNLTPDECKAESIVQRSGEAWKKCRMGEAEWRGLVGSLHDITMLKLTSCDGYWDECIARAVRITAGRLGRPVSEADGVNMTPYARNPGFVGWEEQLEEVRGALATRLGRVCISGMEGIGKTQLALEYAHAYSRQYGNILWVDADPKVLETSYLALADRLRIFLGPGGTASNTTDAVALIRARLEEAEEPNLLVFDNVEDEAGFVRFLPRRGPCHVIVTTRLKSMAHIARVELDVLKKKDALFLARGGRAFDHEEAKQLEVLTARLGYLTLALAVCSRLFAAGKWPSDLLKDLDTKGPHVFSRELEDVMLQNHPDLVPLFETTFAVLEKDGRADSVEKQLAQDLVWAGGWFAPAPISNKLLASAACMLSRSQGALAKAASEEVVREGVGLLVKYGLAAEPSKDKSGSMCSCRATGSGRGDRQLELP